jgi:ferredoxin
VSLTFISMSIALVLSIVFISGVIILNFALGGFEFLFGNPKMTFLKTSYDTTGFAFGYSWNSEKEPANFDTVRVRLFNPFGEKKQVEVISKLTPAKRTFARDIDFGQGFSTLINAIQEKKSKVTVELLATKSGLVRHFTFDSSNFKKQLENANSSVDSFEKENELLELKTYNKIPKRTFVRSVETTNKAKLKIASNPEFANDFTSASTDGAEVENFSVSKVWIEDGCIICDACSDIIPEVFEVLESGCIVVDSAPLDNGLAITEAAEACPVEIIKFNKS